MEALGIAVLLLMLVAFVMLALSPPERLSWRRRRHLGEDSRDGFSGGLSPNSGGDDSHHGHHGDHGGDHGGGHDGGGGGSGDSGGHGGH